MLWESSIIIHLWLFFNYLYIYSNKTEKCTLDPGKSMTRALAAGLSQGRARSSWGEGPLQKRFLFHRHPQALNDGCNAPTVYPALGLSPNWANLSYFSLTKYPKYCFLKYYSATQKLSLALHGLQNPTAHWIPSPQWYPCRSIEPQGLDWNTIE